MDVATWFSHPINVWHHCVWIDVQSQYSSGYFLKWVQTYVHSWRYPYASQGGERALCWNPTLTVQRLMTPLVWCKQRSQDPFVMCFQIGAYLSTAFVGQGVAPFLPIMRALVTEPLIQPQVKRFLQEIKRQQPVECASSPQWELPLVLKALVSNTNEPLEHFSLWALSFNMAMLLALIYAKRVLWVTTVGWFIDWTPPLFLRTQGARSGWEFFRWLSSAILATRA